MSKGAIQATAEMLVALAAAPESEQLDVLATVVKTYLESHRSIDYRRLWTAAQPKE